MIYAIAAIDNKGGLATDEGIPWELPTDKAYFRTKTTGAPVLMGYRVYEEFEQPLPQRQNFVIVRPGTILRDGFEPVEDAKSFLQPYMSSSKTVWVIGGAHVYQQLLPVTQRVYLTRIEHDFNCTKFFPDLKDMFRLTQRQPDQQENDLTFHYEVWDSQPILNQSRV